MLRCYAYKHIGSHLPMSQQVNFYSLGQSQAKCMVLFFCDNSLGFVNLGFKVGSSLEVNLDCFENLSEKSLFSKDHNNISLYTTIMYQYKEFSIQSRVSKWRLKCWRLKQFLFNYSLK
jgi:hypothetical protein